MNESNYLRNSDPVISAGVIGTGDYGTAIVTQALRMPQLRVPILADCDIEAAKRAYQLAGVDETRIVAADIREKALAAIESGRWVVVEDANIMMDLPLDVVVEGTGVTAAGAEYAVKAMRNGKHGVMVTKETEVAVGTILRKIARAEGVVYSGADGDQPALLIALVDWCRQIGLEVLSAGKFGEKRIFIDIENRQLQKPDVSTVELTSDLMEVFRPFVYRTGSREYRNNAGTERMWETLEARADFLGASADIRTDDLTELCIVANAADLTVERQRLHHPVVWQNEMPTVFTPRTYGGILDAPGAIEQASYFNTPNGISMGGGVFVTVHAENAYSNRILMGKGHIVNKDGTSALIIRPYHLCGVETPYSMLAAGLWNRPTSGWSMEQKYDAFGRSKVDLAAGTVISGARGTDF